MYYVCNRCININIDGGSLTLKHLSDRDLKQAYHEACKRGLASDFIKLLHDELIVRGVFNLK
ncbi:sporulation histidine kinase inhibitor Sda [Alkalicoccobacillus gibsonii]|uniref:sporulation histidine kinase inhibitor Sda n=1 Tax=Alkalicoccobacillus gibsonii TaxID=79881 RepID=UPI003F7B9C7F